jgi:hypothetical protein
MYGVPYSVEAYRLAVAGDDTPPHQLHLVRNGQGLTLVNAHVVTDLLN